MTEALLKVTGKVQGVFYRASCGEEAEKLGLTGYAKNMPDGSVEVVLQGEKPQIEEFIKWASSGPDRAVVDRVEVGWMEGGDQQKRRKDFQTL